MIWCFALYICDQSYLWRDIHPEMCFIDFEASLEEHPGCYCFFLNPSFSFWLFLCPSHPEPIETGKTGRTQQGSFSGFCSQLGSVGSLLGSQLCFRILRSNHIWTQWLGLRSKNGHVFGLFLFTQVQHSNAVFAAKRSTLRHSVAEVSRLPCSCVPEDIQGFALQTSSFKRKWRHEGDSERWEAKRWIQQRNPGWKLFPIRDQKFQKRQNDRGHFRSQKLLKVDFASGTFDLTLFDSNATFNFPF